MISRLQHIVSFRTKTQNPWLMMFEQSDDDIKIKVITYRRVNNWSYPNTYKIAVSFTKIDIFTPFRWIIHKSSQENIWSSHHQYIHIMNIALSGCEMQTFSGRDASVLHEMWGIWGYICLNPNKLEYGNFHCKYNAFAMNLSSNQST